MKKMTHLGASIGLWLAGLDPSSAVLGQTHAPPSPPVWTVVNPSWPSTSVLHAKPISLNFQHIDIKALLQVFADFSGLHLVPTDSVTGPVSVRLSDVPWPQALDIVLQSKGLLARQEGRVVWISPQGEWALREKKQLDAQAALDAVSPLHMMSLRLQYARATEVAQRLQGGAAGSSAGRWLSARGSVLAEPRTNQLFILDLPGRLQDLQKMLVLLDVPVRQILIEARIVEADDQFGQSLGVRLGSALAVPLQVQGRSNTLAVGASLPPAAAGTVAGQQVNLPAGLAGQTVSTPATFAVSLFNAAADRFINVEISALEAAGLGKVVSRPRVVTADQTKALIEQGTELPYLTAAGNGVTAISFRKANLKLEVTPQITPDGSVVLEVDVNRDSVGQITAAGYAINTKHVKTQVRVEDGGTVVLGGIYEETRRSDDAKVPGLGDVPGLGWLFKKRDQTQRKSELLIFLTPRVVADGPANVSSENISP
ncbi:type IV pilus secretin PilQ [Limnohabitans sp. G3-2]|uniref:type IV pilus secretin PilQ n=1 Tax=Limnohabitans sp. G3-2 TaxID=1100711 RepID=UPI000C1E5DBE|nr:type IV pilus secretin PilQ [Limnohabitans sp. G3-2]PIT74092.1 pilus assembly protein PilQ [Limnohabitans sp. G3-2]